MRLELGALGMGMGYGIGIDIVLNDGSSSSRLLIGPHPYTLLLALLPIIQRHLAVFLWRVGVWLRFHPGEYF